jgi:hypothetical protein
VRSISIVEASSIAASLSRGFRTSFRFAGLPEILARSRAALR